jgi:hypothetical protein
MSGLMESTWPEQGPRAADATALDEVVERVEHRDDPDLVQQRLGVRGELVERRRRCGQLGDVEHEQAQGHRDGLGVDDAHGYGVGHRVGREDRGLMRRRERAEIVSTMTPSQPSALARS